MADRFDKLSESARRVLTLAQEEAQRLNHSNIGTEHLLLGLVRISDGVAAKVLANLGIPLNKVHSAVEFIIGQGERRSDEEIGLTPRAKKVIELAVEEARRLNDSHIGTEHLLLGLVREGKGIAFGVLESLGISLERVRTEVTRIMNDPVVELQTEPQPLVSDEALRSAAVAACVRASSALLAYDGTELERILLRDDTVPKLQRLRDAVESSLLPGESREGRHQQLLPLVGDLFAVTEALKRQQAAGDVHQALADAVTALHEAFLG